MGTGPVAQRGSSTRLRRTVLVAHQAQLGQQSSFRWENRRTFRGPIEANAELLHAVVDEVNLVVRHKPIRKGRAISPLLISGESVSV